jgi:DNA-binding SARP family transcriptional activator/predicted ATPase
MAAISITLLGGFQVTRDGAAVAHFRGAKVRALLAYLAVEANRPHARAALAALFWPDQPDELALRNLSQALVHLRKALGLAAADPLIESTRHSIRWHAAAATVDLATFTRLAGSADPADLQTAADQYRGEFLAGFGLAACEPFEEWLLLTRERLRQEALGVLKRLADRHLAAQRYADAAQAARRQIALDPWSEAAYRRLMQALVAVGDRAAALAAYEQCRRSLLAELGAEPVAATALLAQQIRNAQSAEPPARQLAGNLPPPFTALVGREEELATLDDLLRATARLVTISGVGGVGKSRLALAAANVVRDAFPDGAWWVSLAGIAPDADERRQASGVASAILAALGEKPSGRRPADADLVDTLRDRRLLIVLDNAEHLPGIGVLVDDVLSACPGLRMLVTSRELLNVYGETILPLEGLPLPAGAAGAARTAAIQLFLERAGRRLGATADDPAMLAGITRLCRVLEGLPLGIELAAHWVDHFTCDEIAAAIQADPAFLEVRDRHRPDRHRSLRAVFDYSWNLLNASERRVLARLTVFLGTFDRQAAQQIAGAPVSVLATLVDKSLLRRVGPGRYSMHELLRQFAAAHLADDPAAQEQLAAQHSSHYLAFVAERTGRLARDDTRQAALEIQQELDNIRQAWRQAVHSGAAAELDAAAYGLMLFVMHSGLLREGAEWFAAAAAGLQQAEAPQHLATEDRKQVAGRRRQFKRWEARGRRAGCGRARRYVGPKQRPPERCGEPDQPLMTLLRPSTTGTRQDAEGTRQAAGGRMLAAAGLIGKLQGIQARLLIPQARHAEALALADSALALGQAAQHAEALMLGTVARAMALRRLGRSDEAQSAFRHALTFAAAAPELLILDMAYVARNWLCSIALSADDYAAALSYAEHNLALCRTERMRRGEFFARSDLIDIAVARGDYATARVHGEAALALAEELQFQEGVAVILHDLSNLARLAGAYTHADALLEQALTIVRSQGHRIREAMFSGSRAYLYIVTGRYDQARAWLDACVALLHAADFPAQEWTTALQYRALLAHAGGDAGQALADAEEAVNRVRSLYGPTHLAQALLVLGRIATACGELNRGETAYTDALAIFAARHPLRAAVAHTGLARVALSRGDIPAAQRSITAVLPILTAAAPAELDDLLDGYLTCYRVLQAAGASTQAATLLERANTVLNTRAAAIADPTWREAFLANVPIHRELALAPSVEA